MTTTPAQDLRLGATYEHGLPLDYFDWLRENAPVFWHEDQEDGGFWALTTHEDVVRVARDPAVFSCEPTTMLSSADVLGDEDHKHIMFRDPPSHTDHRKTLVQDFLPAAVKAMRPRIDELTKEIIDAAAEKETADIVADFAGPIVSSVVAELIGIPIADGKDLFRLTELTLHNEGWADGSAAQAMGEIYGYARALWDDRLKNPQDDLATRLAHGYIGEHKVDAIDFDLYFLLLLNAGGDTSRNAISGGMVGLLEAPDQFRDLKENMEEIIPLTAEEMVRWVSPIIYQRRTVRQDVEIRGQKIEAGQRVAMFYSAANYDPAEFESPREFNARRHPNRHVSFGGAGPHLCLGAKLARHEIESMVSAMITRFPNMTIDGEVTYTGSPIVSGPSKVPVRLR